MAWTKEPPKDEGWYGWRFANGTVAKLVKVQWYKWGDMPKPILISHDIPQSSSTWVASVSGEWWDEPIELPWERKETNMIDEAKLAEWEAAYNDRHGSQGGEKEWRAFVSASTEAMPLLLAEVRRLRGPTCVHGVPLRVEGRSVCQECLKHYMETYSEDG